MLRWFLCCYQELFLLLALVFLCCLFLCSYDGLFLLLFALVFYAASYAVIMVSCSLLLWFFAVSFVVIKVSYSFSLWFFFFCFLCCHQEPFRPLALVLRCVFCCVASFIVLKLWAYEFFNHYLLFSLLTKYHSFIIYIIYSHQCVFL